MSLGSKRLVFSYNVKAATSNDTLASERIIVKLNLKELIPADGYSPLIAIETLKLAVYDEDCNVVPVKFSILNATMNKHLTQDPCVASSIWSPDPGPMLNRTKVAGTELSPYRRTLTVTEEENRQAVLNILSFMMSTSVQAATAAMASKSCLEEVTGPNVKLRTTEFQCAMCLRERTASVKEDLQFGMPCCHNGLICAPMQCRDSLQKLAVVARMATVDNLHVLRLALTQLRDQTYPQQGHLADRDRIFTESSQGEVVVHYKIMTFLTSLYSTLGEIAATFFTLDEKHSHVNLLMESPKEKLLALTGELTMSLLYGPHLRSIYRDLSAEESVYLADDRVSVLHMTPDVIIKTFPLHFYIESDAGSPKDWHDTWYV